ncbi:MAG: hypothetical protein IIC74_08360 [Bacteroidetes bacterium]|nr:hypothetical protein [Bacteroidota bacterium]
MSSTKKLIEIDDKALAILEKEAKKQKRSLKNYLEFTLENIALRFSEPSEEYKAMMDDMLDRIDKGEIDFIPVEEVRKKYDI